VKTSFTNVRQSLPAVVSIEAFLSSHQTSIAQLAITYCSALVDDVNARSSYFPGLNFSSDITAQRSALIDPLVARAIGTAASQPTAAEAETELNALITRLCAGGTCSTGARTPTVVKAVCGAAVGNAAVLIR
jgi:hypothetical protein